MSAPGADVLRLESVAEDRCRVAGDQVPTRCQPIRKWNLKLARAWGVAAAQERLTLAALFDGLNAYLGNYLGEFVGEASFSLFFALTGVGFLRHATAPRWLAGWGIATGLLGLVGMWRNLTGTVAVVAGVAEANNYLLPAWMIGLGVWLILESRRKEA